MSQIETNPLNTPTTTVRNPTQVMEIKSTTQMTDFRFDPLQCIRTPDSTFSMEQLDWVNLAKKNKYFNSFIWNVNDSSPWINIPIDYNFVRQFIPVGTKFNSYSNFNTLLISIKPTSNAYFQGLTLLHWDPAPAANYYSDILGFALNDFNKFQFKRVQISPKTSNEINITIPINFPFEFFKNDVPVIADQYVANYMSNYLFGTLRSTVLVPLQTTSPLTRLVYTFSAQLLDLSTAGLNINPNTI